MAEAKGRLLFLYKHLINKGQQSQPQAPGLFPASHRPCHIRNMISYPVRFPIPYERSTWKKFRLNHVRIFSSRA